jgi:tetratricopeptide (TPR) repeat protein
LNLTEVAEILKEFCSTIPSYGEYMENRELLKSTLAVFDEDPEDPENPEDPEDPERYLSTQAEVLSGLAYLCSKMGDWKDATDYLKKAEEILKDPKYTTTSSDPKYALTAKENLAVAYSELGKHGKCIALLKEVRDQIEETYGADHPALAVPLARLSAAHYYNRERDESQKLAETVLTTNFKRFKSVVHIPWNAVQILGTTACDFGDIARGNEQKLIDRMKDYERQAEWSVATELLRGRMHRLLGDTKQAQETLEGALRKSENKYGSNNIRKLKHYLIHYQVVA